MSDEHWASTSLANLFVDEAYASVKGYVMHQHLLEHLPPPPAKVLDVGGGAGHQSLPLAQAGYDVAILDPSPAMLDKARQRLELLPTEAQERVTLIEADGENADEAVGGDRFAGVLCHGVLGYLEEPRAIGGAAVPVCRGRRHYLDHERQRPRHRRPACFGTEVGGRAGIVRHSNGDRRSWGARPGRHGGRSQ
jgi:SAM-dependent methyltransferase